MVMPHLPEGTAETLQSKMNGAVAHLTVAVEKADSLACGGVDQLVEKVPALKEATPELVKNTKATLATYFTSATSFLASFSLAQVALKVVDTGLEVVEQLIAMTGGSEENIITSGIKTIHTTAINDPQGGGGRQLGPVGGPAQPVQVIPEELVVCCSTVHQTIGNNRGCVTDGHTDSILGLLQDQGVCVVIPDQELEVQVYWLFS